jgi:predicted metal-dependent phosphoesterase TrpH
MESYIDLHTHTTASDGADTPAELVRLAAAAGLAAIALTDHDTISGLEEAEDAGRAYGVEVVRGAELSVSSICGELHLLGLWLGRDTREIEAALRGLRRRRDDRNRLIIARLNALGVPLTHDDVLREAGGEVIGRPHIALALVRCGHVPDQQAAFDRYLRSGAAAFVPKRNIDAARGVRLLAGFGATTAVAHPGLLRAPRADIESCVADLRGHGLHAIEVWHSEHSADDEQFLMRLARRHGLALTGGSDYHGALKPAVRLGRGRGGLRIGMAVMEALKQQRRDLGMPV